MNARTPQLRRHKTGVWFCRWGGRDHYFTKSKRDSQARYLESLKLWAEWRGERNTKRLPLITQSIAVVDVADLFLQAKALERGEATREYYRKHIKRFLLAYGPVRCDMIKAQHLQGLKEDMLRHGFAPKTVNHDLGAVKTMLRWAMDFDYMPIVRLEGVKKIPLGPPKVKAVPIEEIKNMAEQAPETMAPWLALNYLCLMRPSEVIRVARKEGEWIEDGIYEIENKVGRRTGMHRQVVFSDEALEWFALIEPRWSRLDSYSQAVRDFFGSGGPGRLRHSAATHLHRVGVARGDVDILLGHLPGRVSLTYAPIAWQPLRALAARLTLRSDAESHP